MSFYLIKNPLSGTTRKDCAKIAYDEKVRVVQAPTICVLSVDRKKSMSFNY